MMEAVALNCWSIVDSSFFVSFHHWDASYYFFLKKNTLLWSYFIFLWNQKFINEDIIKFNHSLIWKKWVKITLKLTKQNTLSLRWQQNLSKNRFFQRQSLSFFITDFEIFFKSLIWVQFTHILSKHCWFLYEM